MHPHLFNIFGIEIRSFGLMAATGLLLAFWLMRKRCIKVKEDPEKLSDVLFFSMIGALIGGAIGNKLGEGGGKAGSTAIGAIIGSEVVRSDKQARAENNKFVEKEVCRIQNITYTETSEQITGYKLNVEIDGQILEFRSNSSYNPGQTIAIRKEINYFLD